MDNETLGDTLVVAADSTFYWAKSNTNWPGESRITPKERWDYIRGDTLAMKDGACITGAKTCTGFNQCFDGTRGVISGDCLRAMPGYKVPLQGKKLTFTHLPGSSANYFRANTYRRVE